MRALKLLTVLLALSSTIALILASRATSRPLLSIAQVRPSMNFAYVRIAGVVPAYPSLADDFLSFRVLDDSGEMRVMAYRSTREQLRAQRRIPMPGDRVSVEGTLRIRDDDASLILNAADALSLHTPDAMPVRLAALDALQLGARAQISGQVRRLRDVSDALRIATLRDGNAVADVLMPLDNAMFGDAPEIQVGDWISVTGGVGEYRGAKQLLPSAAKAILRVRHAARDESAHAIAALDKSKLGQWVMIVGQVSDLRPITGGMRVDVSDASGASMTVVMFDSVWQSLPVSLTLSVGDPVRMQGELAEYRGELEILPELPVDVELILQ
jgi:DNA/RNA endonuclease YhcR with UshA esterase domain